MTGWSEKLTAVNDRETIIVEGRWCVEALLQNRDFDVDVVLVARGCHEEILENYSQTSGDVLFEIVPKKTLCEWIGYAFHRGILAIARRPAAVSFSAARQPLTAGTYVCCPELADAANLGAIVRTSAALGASGVLVGRNSGADIYSRKSIRASSGAVFRLPVFESEDLFEEICYLRESEGFSIVGTALDPTSLSICEAPKIDKGVIIFGPENGGLSQIWLDRCDEKLTIPMANEVDSLNVAASAAIVLWELMR